MWPPEKGPRACHTAFTKLRLPPLRWKRRQGCRAGRQYSNHATSEAIMRKTITALTRVGIFAAIVGGSVLVAGAADISGAGATFPYPIYAKWADAYKKETGVGLNYQSI